MDNDKLQRIQAHAREIAALLYEETSPEQLTTLEGIETAVRGHLLNHVSPEIGVFYRNNQRQEQRSNPISQKYPQRDRHHRKPSEEP